MISLSQLLNESVPGDPSNDVPPVTGMVTSSTDGETPSYMNVSSLKSIKANVEFLLSAIQEDTELGNWAEDHIATAAHDLSQVADYMRGKVTESGKPAKGKKWKTNGVSHGEKGVTISPGSKRGDAYCARSAGIKGDWKSDPNSPNNLSRKKWKCRGKKSMK